MIGLKKRQIQNAIHKLDFGDDNDEDDDNDDDYEDFLMRVSKLSWHFS